MSSTNFKKALSEARKSMQESKSVRTLYYQQDEDQLDEIAGLSDLIGLAKKFVPNFQKLSASVLSAFKSGAKAVWDVVKKDFEEAAAKAVANLERQQASKDRAIKMGVPEALAGAPSAFWLVELGEREMNDKEAMLLIDKYMPDGQALSDENKNLYDILYKEVIGESPARTTEMIVEGWQKSLLIEAAVDDYEDKPVPEWVIKAVKDSRRGDYSEALEVGEFRDDEWLAKLVISIILVAVGGDEEKLLEMMYKEEPSDKDKQNRSKLAGRVETSYVPRIIAIHAALLSERDGSDPATDGLNKEFRGSLTGKLNREWEKSKGDLKDWEKFSRKNDKDLSDLSAFAKFLSDQGPGGDEEDESAEDLRNKAGIDLNMKRVDMLKSILSSDEWYTTVAKVESGNSERALKEIVANFQKVVQENLVELMSPAKLSDLSGANKTFKDGFQAFVEAEGDEGYLNQAHELAMQENDDEMMSRLLAQYRPSYAEAYIEEMKSDTDFKNTIAPKLEDFKKLAEKPQYGYDSGKDPMWEKMEEILESAKDQVIGSLESGISELEKQRDKAQDEMQKIMDARAEEEGSGEEGPDTDDVSV